MPKETHPCPICGIPTVHTERYPRSVCGNCTVRARDSTGQRIVGYNVSFNGGFVAHYRDTDSGEEVICAEVTESGRCWIDGVTCAIGEARFGGIVVQA